MAEKANKYGETGEAAKLRKLYDAEKDAKKKAAIKEQLRAAREAAGLRTQGPQTPEQIKEQNIKKNEKTLFGEDANKAAAGRNLYAEIMGDPKQVTDQYQSLVDQNIQRGTDLYNTSGANNPAMADALANLSNLAHTSGEVDPTRQQIMDLYLSRMNGLTPDEMQVIRESNMGGLNRSLQTAMRLGTGTAAASGYGGGAAGALSLGAQRQYLDSSRQLERDIIQKNIDLKAANLNAAGTYASSMDNDRWERMNATGANYMQGAGMAGQQQIDAFQSLSNVLTNQQAFAGNLQKLNNDSLNAWQLGSLGASLGGAGYADSRADAQKAFDLQKAQIDAMGKTAFAGGGLNFGGGGMTFEDEFDDSSGGGTTSSSGSSLPSGAGGITRIPSGGNTSGGVTRL